MFGIGMGEFLLILIVGLIVFGPKNLPELGKTLGKGLREFRKAQAALSATLEESVNDPVKKSLDKDKPPTVAEKSDSVQVTKNEVGADSVPKELYTGTAAENKNSEKLQAASAEKNPVPKEIPADTAAEKVSEPARTSVDDLINTVKENPLSAKKILNEEKSA